MDEKIMLIAQRLAALREIMGVSTKDMASATGLSEAQYLEYEDGKCDFSFSFMK